MDMKRFFLYAIMIAALALAGCGGGGNGPDPGMGENGSGTGNGTPTAAEMTVTAVITALNAAGADLAADASSTDIVTAIQALDAEDPTLMAVREALGLGATATQVMILDRIGDLVGPSADAVAGAFAPAIAKPVDPAAMSLVFDNRFDRGNPTGVTVDGGKVAGDADTPEFTMSSTTPADLSADDFTGSVHTRTAQEAVMDDPDTDANESMPEITNTVTVYTDQMPPTDTAFATVHMLNAGGDPDGADGNAATEEDNIPHTELSLTDIGSIVGKTGMGLALVKLTANVPPTGTLTFALMMDATITGTFDGAEGMYKCGAGTCSITLDTDGNPTNVNNLTFMPAGGAMIPAPDTDYLQFGYWVQTTMGADGPSHALATFAGGSMPFTVSAVSSLVGEAKYSGPATGMYVVKGDVHNDGMGPVPTASGQFTADAELTATFGTPGTIGSVFHNTVGGSVTDFTDQNGDLIPGWTLALQSASIANLPSNGLFTGMTSAGDNLPLGGWRGQFFGPTTDDDSTTIDVDETETGYPNAVVGEFNGHFANGHALGAFGATIDEE